MKTIDKKKSNAFGKDTYLIGKDKDGDYIWLEAARFDRGWYWGFGYIEVYTHQLDPANARDINSHSHYSGLTGKQEGGGYNHHVNEVLAESVLSDSESWELADLMKSFYTLSDAASLFKNGSSGVSSPTISSHLTSESMRTEINEAMLPKVFARIYEILSPESEVKPCNKSS